MSDKSKPSQTFADSTEAVHAGRWKERAHNSLGMPIAHTATFTFLDSADLIQYMEGRDPDRHREEYGRYGNPTVMEVEERLAALDGAASALLFSSGMAAITTSILALVKAGDHVVLFQDCYRRTRQFVTKTLGQFGVTHTLIPPGDLAALEEAITPQTRLVISESPTNPYLMCVDLKGLAAIGKKHRRVKIMVDATFATPINQRPAEMGIDLVVHSATKYLAGHNDALAGVVCGPSHLIGLIRESRGVLGSVCSPDTAFLINRGLKTLALRVRQQNQTALAVATALEGHRHVEKVYYPGLASHPNHQLASEQLKGGGGVVSFIVKGGMQAASDMVDGCRLCTIAPSLGGVETLIDQPCLMSFFELDDEGLKAVGIHPALIRLSVGIEETDAVVSDLMAALDSLDSPA